MGASSRLRNYQYLGKLAQQNLEVEFSPLFDDPYLKSLYARKSTFNSAFGGYFSRLRAMAYAGTFDLLWIEKEVFPWVPWMIESHFLPRDVPIVTDYDDAIFHNYDLHRSKAVRWLIGQKINRLMAASTLVVAGNNYLAARARAAGAPRVEVVPTVVDMCAYGLKPQIGIARPTVLGWIGSPSTWTEYMAPMMPLFASISEGENARLTAVGAGKVAVPHPTLDSLPWSEETEVAMIQAMDVGLMPLTDTPWARGKCGYKLIQYMACGLPVIASPVGVNADIVEHGVNGFLATSDLEWTEALRLLLNDPALRAKMGREGRRKVEERYSLQVWGPRVAQLLRSAIK